MAYTLVGTIGAVTQGASGAAVTPAWGTSENRTANHLLVCVVAVTGTATLPTTPSGWNLRSSVAGTSCSAVIYEKLATGSDAAPTIAAIPGGTIAAQLAEFSGNATASEFDQSGTAAGITSPQAATAAAVDAAAGELLISAAAHFRNTAGTGIDADSFNNGATANTTNNTNVSTQAHYDFAWGVTTGNAAADSNSFSFSTSHVTGVAVAIASFKLPGGTAFTQPLTAALSFAGSGPVRAIKTNFTSVLSFVGGSIRRMSTKLIAGLGFVGSVARAVRTGFGAGLSFVGALANQLSHANITLRNVSTTSLTPSAALTITVAKPAGVVSGDVMYAFVDGFDAVNHATAAGWTEVAFASQSGVTQNSLTALRKVAGASEPTAYTFSQGANCDTAAIVALSGVDNTTPEDVAAIVNGGTGASVVAQSITPVTNQAWHLVAFATGGAPTTLSVPTGYTNDVATFGGGGDLQQEDHKLISPPAATGTVVATQNDTGGWATVSLAIRPAAISGTVFTSALTAALSFTGASSRRVSTGLGAVLSFAGQQGHAIRKLIAAGLSFAGTQARLVTRLFAGVLGFAGALAQGRQFARILTATVNFTGAISRQTNHGMAAAASFVGSQGRIIRTGIVASLAFAGLTRRGITTGLAVATLSFAGTMASGKQLFRTLTASLGFVGAMASHNVLHQALTATLSFTGTQTKTIQKQVVGAMSFVGTQMRTIHTGLVAVLSFAGSLPRRIQHGFGAAVTFTGAVATNLIHSGTQFAQALAANLSFTGAQSRQIGKAVAGALGFVGAIPQRQIRTGLAAALGFSGARASAIRTGFVAMLAFTGALPKLIQRALSGGMSFIGGIATASFHIPPVLESLFLVGTRVVTALFGVSNQIGSSGANGNLPVQGQNTNVKITGGKTGIQE